jgi:hypothetical protein
MAIQRLTAAYRSRSRPSSTLGAKASTMCPYYLDGDLVGREPCGSRPVIPVSLATVQFSRSAKRKALSPADRGHEALRSPATRRSLKTQQHATALARAQRAPAARLPDSVDMSSDRMRSELRTRELQGAREASASGIRCPRRGGLPRKEVIQPQLPLRLPCYDFTPVTSPTFDGSLPKGLGHRLRVLLTPMV